MNLDIDSPDDTWTTTEKKRLMANKRVLFCCFPRVTLGLLRRAHICQSSQKPSRRLNKTLPTSVTQSSFAGSNWPYSSSNTRIMPIIMKMAFNILLVAYLLLAVAAMSADSTAWQRARLGQPTSYSNFSVYCGNIIPYGTSTSIISASCSGQGYDLAAPVDLYQSHIDLNQCLTNTDGKISAHAE